MDELQEAGRVWCLENLESLREYAESGVTRVAVHPGYGVVIAEADEEEFNARCNELRPSVLKQLYRTSPQAWIHECPSAVE